MTSPSDPPTTATATTAAATVSGRPAGYEPAVAPGDLPLAGTLGTLTRRRWTTIVPRAVLLVVLIGSLLALGIAIAVVVAALVLAATAG